MRGTFFQEAEGMRSMAGLWRTG